MNFCVRLHLFFCLTLCVAPSTVWTPLGPAPLASDATGLGVQDYGLVAGRATAVAVDPADGTGNTVYIGGAYGGVWKSTNARPASANPSSVTWNPMTDDQPTLASAYWYPAAEAAAAQARGVGGTGAGHPGTTPGAYSITVTGAVGSVPRTAEAALTVQ
jgi:hypothetical protein